MKNIILITLFGILAQAQTAAAGFVCEGENELVVKVVHFGPIERFSASRTPAVVAISDGGVLSAHVSQASFGHTRVGAQFSYPVDSEAGVHFTIQEKMTSSFCGRGSCDPFEFVHTGYLRVGQKNHVLDCKNISL